MKRKWQTERKIVKKQRKRENLKKKRERTKENVGGKGRKEIDK